MIDWLSSMQQTYEYYIVDPITWTDVAKIDNVKSCSITRDSEVETLGSAIIDVESISKECYIRTYLIAIQNGITYKIPLGTHLVQTPSTTFNGMCESNSLDAYTPLLELKENPPPIGYSLLKGTNILDASYKLIRENLRAPVVKSTSSSTLQSDFIANTDDTWMTFTKELVACANYNLGLDELGRILFLPNQDTASLQPVWTYTDDNCSILYPDITINRDMYSIPNVVEVVYSNGEGYMYSKKAINDDPNSPTSTVSRGRKITYRETNPSFYGKATQAQLDEYAVQLLRDLSAIEYKISYTHGYCPVRIGDCVMFNCKRANLNGIKAKVISQTIKCEPGCPVSEKAVFTTNLWR